VAGDQVEMMAALGFDRFAVVGDDLGGRVAHRFALDHTERVTKLAMLDIVRPYAVFAWTNSEIALSVPTTGSSSASRSIFRGA
jgi:haloacetate dehalogenase